MDGAKSDGRDVPPMGAGKLTIREAREMLCACKKLLFIANTRFLPFPDRGSLDLDALPHAFLPVSSTIRDHNCNIQ